MMARGILGKKLGMTQIFEADGTLVPVTVVEAGPCVVLANKTEETDGYNAIQLGFGDIKEKHVNKPMKGFFDKAGVAPVKFVREFRLAEASEYKAGDKIAADIFAAGDLVDAIGPMHSGPGGRVIKGKKLPGRLGGQSATVQRLTIAKVDAERNLIMVKGSVPGAAGTFLMLRDTVRPVVKKADKK